MIALAAKAAKTLPPTSSYLEREGRLVFVLISDADELLVEDAVTDETFTIPAKDAEGWSLVREGHEEEV